MINGILVRYFEGEASEEEIVILELWRNESPENEVEFQEFKQVWNATLDLKEIDELDIESDLKLVKSKYHHKDTPIRKMSILSKIAAILLPIFVLGFVISYYLTNSTPSGEYVLSDGTKVWVKGDSKLDFPAHFEGNTRTVSLTGEAFFEVAKNPEKPFIIKAGATHVEVVGTSFDVNTNDAKTTIVVATGKVKFYEKDNPTHLVLLTSGEKGIFDGNQIREIQNEDKNYASWHTGHFEFMDERIGDVLDDLSSYYGKLELSKNLDPDCLFKGVFDKESKENVIETLELSCGVK